MQIFVFGLTKGENHSIYFSGILIILNDLCHAPGYCQFFKLRAEASERCGFSTAGQ